MRIRSPRCVVPLLLMLSACAEGARDGDELERDQARAPAPAVAAAEIRAATRAGDGG
ncbi:MAG TPA: hypothetical protein VNB06_06365 [Thermoanaerobaculia bacterium]|nr:hypothetical protein [Thermoanaerobaculia bacterium]